MGGEIPNPPTDTGGGLAHSVAQEIAETGFTVTIVTPTDSEGNPMRDDSVTYDPHEIGIHGPIEEE